MQNNHTTKKRGRNVLWDTRLAITALAVGGTIGFWNFFSTQMLNESTQTPQPATPNDSTAAQTVVVNLPPMPTLLPPSAQTGTLQGNTTPNLPGANVPQQSFQPGMQILLGGSSPQVRRIAPAPVTRTRSSQ